MNPIEALIVATAIAVSPPIDNPSPEGECLALNMYYEARNQGTAGLLGVTSVVLNRVNDRRFPNTICEVVKQGPTRESWKTKKTLDKNDAIYYPIKNKCQFSWYCDGKPDTPHDLDAYRWAEIIVRHVWDQQDSDITGGATHYHSIDVKPEWAKDKTFLGRVGDHLFYRWER